MNPQPLLTLAVIVKDEADLLERLLTHHRTLYDEAVVVDTGSSDDSAEVARRLGARVFEFPWIDDFSAARNYGLDQVRGRWILQLDCDELLAPETHQELRQSLKQAPEACYCLPVHNYTEARNWTDWLESSAQDRPWNMNSPGYFLTCPIRIFPNRQDLRFKGVIHENLTRDSQKLGLRLEKWSQVIHHTGLLEPEGRLRRDLLYGRLLRKKIQQEPHNLAAITEMGRYLVSHEQWTLAEKLLLGGLANEKISGTDMMANLLLVEIQVRLGQLDQAAGRLERTMALHPAQHLCWVQAATLNLLRGRNQTARLYLEQGRKLFPQSPALRELAAKV